MLNYNHQLVTNYVCLLVSTDQVVYIGFLELFMQEPTVCDYKQDWLDQWE